jgi:hypothetical protein
MSATHEPPRDATWPKGAKVMMASKVTELGGSFGRHGVISCDSLGKRGRVSKEIYARFFLVRKWCDKKART